MRMRDGEEVGFGDNYYYQMAGYIRQYKGTGAVTQASGQTSIDLTDAASFANVGPVYGDNVGDTEWRHEEGYFTGQNYVNNSGRNDFVSAKVSQDAEYLYFMVETAENIIVDDGSAWMNLYIDIDNDHTTGWEGFDFALNRVRDGHYVSVESMANGWEGKHIGRALYTVSGNQMVVRLSKAVIGVEGVATTLGFKWADNSTRSGNVMEFMDLGDTAPNDRYAYLYVCPEGQGTGAVTTSAYTLLAEDGSVVASKDETKPMDGFGTPDDSTLNENETDVGDDVATDAETDSEQENLPADSQSSPNEVWMYSIRLKIMIVATGGVLGLCAYVAIVIPSIVKKRKQN